MRLGSFSVLVLALQILFQMKIATAALSTLNPQGHDERYGEMQDFVHSLKNPNNPIPPELEKIHQVLITSNRGGRRGRPKPRPRPPRPTPSRTPTPTPTPTPSRTPAPEICQMKEESSIFVFGRCPDVCEPFSRDAFVKCGSLIQFGCAMESCGPGMFTCTLQADLSANFVICPGDKVLFESVSVKSLQRVSFLVDLRGAEPLRTDLYLLSDATGSMGTAINTVKTKFQDLINTFGSRDNVAFGVGFYRDETELSGGFRNSQSITEDEEAVKTAVNGLRATGGGDVDEANLVALYRVATDSSIGWREGSRRILVYFGDFPGHEPTCVGSKKITRTEVIAALKAKGITVVAVNFPPPGIDVRPRLPFGSCHREPAAGPGQASSITSGTGGSLVRRDDQAELVSAIGEAVGTLTRTFDVDESECVANIDSVHTPALPITLEAGEETTVTNTISVRNSICATVGSFECRYKYTESGADLGPIDMEFVDIRGC